MKIEIDHIELKTILDSHYVDLTLKIRRYAALELDKLKRKGEAQEEITEEDKKYGILCELLISNMWLAFCDEIDSYIDDEPFTIPVKELQDYNVEAARERHHRIIAPEL